MSRSTSSNLRELNRGLDHVVGVFLVAWVVFAPWAFGSTTSWAAWTTTALAYAVGLVSVARRICWGASGCSDPRWNTPGRGAAWSRALAVVAVLVVAYVGISVLNARARVLWNDNGLDFDYREFVPWLPTTYDLDATTRAFVRYAGLALAFWGTRDWLVGMTRGERHRAEDGRLGREAGRVPGRLRILLWTFAVSTALMSLVGMLHRLDGSHDLLWLRKVRMYSAESMFGPFPYRANGAQYLNLVWPLVLGFWWILRREAKRTLGPGLRMGGGSHIVLLPCAALILAGSLVAASRGGVIVGLVELVLVVAVLTFSGRRQRGIHWMLSGLVAFVVGVGWLLAGDFLEHRFREIRTDQSMSGRTNIYASARRIAEDFPVFGTGAESFMAISGLYREKPSSDWPAYVHNDWLEARVTLGWVGYLLVLALLVLVPVVHLRHGVLPVSPEFRVIVAIALGGMLLHARFDFPFQILSLHAAFLVVAAMATVLSPLPEAASLDSKTDGTGSE